MNLSISEQTKHRLIGLVVLISIAVIFLPALMKKSNRNFEKNIKLALKLPAKPELPKVAAPTNQALFKQAKIAKAPVVEVASVRRNSVIAKASPLNTKSNIKQETQLAKAVANPTTNLKDEELMFSIQVATFTQRSNADILVEKLKDNGYLASYNIIDRERGNLYQVVVGKLSEREEAVDLQKKLITKMQLNGFIVQTGVS
ncbi:MAG: SPOR domain-containing protein [Legionellaceae bacterium]|nr:SPOR domain-containing protein [Legionellaceae bacterium]